MISGYCLGYNEEPAVTFNLSLCHTTAGWERTERTDWGPGEILIGNLTLFPTIIVKEFIFRDLFFLI